MISPCCLSVYVSPPFLKSGSSPVYITSGADRKENTSNSWTHRFLCGQCHIKRKYVISSTRNFVF
jgi:hypothetical protein